MWIRVGWGGGCQPMWIIFKFYNITTHIHKMLIKRYVFLTPPLVEVTHNKLELGRLIKKTVHCPSTGLCLWHRNIICSFCSH